MVASWKILHTETTLSQSWIQLIQDITENVLRTTKLIHYSFVSNCSISQNANSYEYYRWGYGNRRRANIVINTYVDQLLIYASFGWNTWNFIYYTQTQSERYDLFCSSHPRKYIGHLLSNLRHPLLVNIIENKPENCIETSTIFLMQLLIILLIYRDDMYKYLFLDMMKGNFSLSSCCCCIFKSQPNEFKGFAQQKCPIEKEPQGRWVRGGT